MGWKKLNRILHRDIGYFCIGLTLVYAVSGIAVNHLSHNFNPSYIIEKSQSVISPLKRSDKPDQVYIDSLLRDLGIDEKFKNGAMLSPESIRIFTETYTIDAEIFTGRVSLERVRKVPVLYEMNYLHLNKAKGMWTFIADIYGVGLAFLAISGLLMIHRRTRIRGTVLTIAGIILPAVFLVFTL